MDVFGQGLGHLDREAVQVEVILVAVLGEPLAGGLRGAPPHRHNLQADHVTRPFGDVAEEIGNAEPTILVLLRERA